MSDRRDALVLAILLASLAALALVLRPRAAEMAGGDPRVSTFRVGPTGARALFLLAAELDLPARQSLRPWFADTAAGALIVLAPVEQPTPREVAALRTWVSGGGTLIYAAARGGDAVGRSFGLRTTPLRPASAGALEAARWSGATSFPMPHAWTAGVDSVGGFVRAFDRAALLQHEGAIVLLATAAGEPAVVTFASGAGRVIAWSDAVPLSNQELRAGGAALLFARAASSALQAGGMLRFDEYHHGYREASPVRALWRFATGTGTGRALLQGAAACLLLLLLGGARFGAPAHDISARRRSPLEHVDAVAGAYRRADARRTTRRLLLAGLERRLGRRILGADAAPDAAALARSPAAQRLLDEWAHGAGGDLVALAAAVDDYVADARRPH